MNNVRLELRVAKSALFGFAAHAASLAIVFVGLALLARILAPRDFGLFAMAMAVVGFFEVSRDFGLGQALIYYCGQADDDEPILGTGFALSVGVGAIITMLLLIGAPIAGAFFGDDEVTSLIQALAIYFLIAGIGIVPDALLRQKLKFDRRFWPQVAAPLARYGVAVALGLLGFGAWSLVAGQLAGMSLSVALCLRLAGWRPSWQLRTDLVPGLLTYGGMNTIITLLAAVILSADYLLIGRFLGSQELGVYALAFKLPDATLVTVAFVLSTVLLPAYVAIGSDLDGLRDAYLDALHVHALLMSPVAAGIYMLAPLLVPTLFGDRWLPAVPVLQFLAIASFLRAVVFSAGAVFIAVGRPGLLIAAQIAWTAAVLPMTYLAAQISIVAVAAVQIGAVLVYIAATLIQIRRVIELSLRSVAAVTTPGILAAMLMMLVLRAMLGLLDGSNPLVVLLLGVALGGVTYIWATWMLDRSAFRHAAQLGMALARGSGQGEA